MDRHGLNSKGHRRRRPLLQLIGQDRQHPRVARVVFLEHRAVARFGELLCLPPPVERHIDVTVSRGAVERLIDTRHLLQPVRQEIDDEEVTVVILHRLEMLVRRHVVARRDQLVHRRRHRVRRAHDQQLRILDIQCRDIATRLLRIARGDGIHLELLEQRSHAGRRSGGLRGLLGPEDHER